MTKVICDLCGDEARMGLDATDDVILNIDGVPTTILVSVKMEPKGSRKDFCTDCWRNALRSFIGDQIKPKAVAARSA